MRAQTFLLLIRFGREPDLESPSDQGRGTQWSVAGEVVWRDGDGGLWRHKVWETLGSQTPTKTGIVRWADDLPGLSRNGSKV